MLLLLLACVAPDGDPSKDDTADSLPESEVLELSLAATASPTVFRAAFDAPAGMLGTVEYGVDGDLDHTVEAEEVADGRYEVVLMGIAADAAWSARAAVEVDEELQVSPPVELPEAAAPTWLPHLTVTAGTVAPTGGFWLVTHGLPGNGGVSVVDGEGRYVWWQKGADDPYAMVMSAWMSPDGSAVEWLEVGVPVVGDVIHHTPLDGSAGFDVSVHGAHHDFVALGGDRWATLVDDIRPIDGVNVIGDALVEVNRDGSQRVVWNAWDWLDPSLDTMGMSDPDGTWWTHANGLWFDAVSNRYFVSLYGRSLVAVIDADTGVMETLIGGTPEATTRVSGGPGFASQHGPVVSGNRLMIFDNGNFSPEGVVSTVRTYELGDDLSTAVEVQTVPNPDGAFVPNFGNAVPRSDGGTFVSWGSMGRLNEFAADGSVRWQLDASLGSPFAYVRPIAHLGAAPR